jgi:hypothetical protein
VAGRAAASPKFPPVIRAFGCLPGVFVLCGEGC